MCPNALTRSSVAKISPFIFVIVLFGLSPPEKGPELWDSGTVIRIRIGCKENVVVSVKETKLVSPLRSLAYQGRLTQPMLNSMSLPPRRLGIELAAPRGPYFSRWYVQQSIIAR